MDSLVKALILDNEAIAVACKTTDIVNTAMQKHDLSPTPSAALGRLMTAALMMSTELKNADDSLTITISGNGLVGSVVASADANFTVRGYVDNPHAEAPIKENGKLNVSGIVGTEGKLTVIKSDGENKPYVGISPIVSGEIAEDLSQYYHFSEQKSTVISLGVLVSNEGKCISAGGLSIHVLPFASDETLSKIGSILPKVSGISNILIEKTPKQFISELFFGSINIVEEVVPVFECKCCEDSILKVLATLSEDEIQKIKKEQGKVEIICHFCSKKYEF